jgi:plasmid stabilization system protein ParE
LGRVVPEFKHPDFHEVIVSPYRVIYRIKDGSGLIEVIRVWHAARDTPEFEIE